MANKTKFETISIYDALENIKQNKYLLPSIQRKYVWKSEQIEALFDSIMNDYPINTFMFWKITDGKIKNDYKFYDFLRNYREHFKEQNEHVHTAAKDDDFFAVIDGQQRLTSLYIALKGTYAYKMPRVWWIDCEENIPTRKLYLDLIGEYQNEDDERQLKYHFKFLTENEYAKSLETDEHEWFSLHELYRFSDENEFLDYVYSKDWKNKPFVKKTLPVLYRKIFIEELITFYKVEKQEIDTVLDIFIRTNGGGVPLSYSNLLMSFVTSNWQKDTRSEFQSLCDQVFKIGNPGFMINSDFILKTCLVLFCKDIKFRLKNFKKDVVSEIEDNWERISKCIRVAFKLIESWGFNYSNMKAMNAVIPIIYFIYQHNLEGTINSPIQYREQKEIMRKWFCISILRRVFSGQTDWVLTAIRRVLDEHRGETDFPFDAIKDTFRGNQSKSLSFDDEVIDGLLSLHKDNPSCYSVMVLIYSHLGFGDQIYHLDHLHPAAFFANLKMEDSGMTEEEYSFYKDSEHWDTIPNLQLLDGIKNESKNAKPLAEWVKEQNVNLDNQLIPTDVSLDVKDFREFLRKRKALLKERLMNIIK